MSDNPDRMYQKVAANLRRIRMAQEISVRNLAACADASEMTVRAYEAGQGRITLRTIGRMADALGCAPEDILGVDTTPPDLAHAAASVLAYCKGPKGCPVCSLYNQKAQDCYLHLKEPYNWMEISCVERAAVSMDVI